MTKHATTDDLRAAIKAALPDMASDQFRAAQALLDALTPPMEEPTWPGAPVIAACHPSVKPSLHTRYNSSSSRWECKFRCTSTPWGNLIKPRPLTAEEYAEHRIPMPAEPITDELVERCAKAAWGELWERIASNTRSRFRAVLLAAGHPEAGE